jgi:hypothetical protein
MQSSFLSMHKPDETGKMLDESVCSVIFFIET